MLGLAFAVSAVIASTFVNDALDVIVDLAFFQTNRQDAMLIFNDEVPESALEDIRRLPAVLQAEGQQFYPAVLRKGHLEKRLGLEARRPGSDLARVVDTTGRVSTPQPGGILLSERLAAFFGVVPGDSIEVSFLSGLRETHRLEVNGVVEQYFGLGAYMDFDDLNALFRQAPRLTTVNVTLDSTELHALHSDQGPARADRFGGDDGNANRLSGYHRRKHRGDEHDLRHDRRAHHRGRGV